MLPEALIEAIKARDNSCCCDGDGCRRKGERGEHDGLRLAVLIEADRLAGFLGWDVSLCDDILNLCDVEPSAKAFS